MAISRSVMLGSVSVPSSAGTNLPVDPGNFTSAGGNHYASVMEVHI